MKPILSLFVLCSSVAVICLTVPVWAQTGGCTWCLPPIFEDGFHTDPSSTHAHYQPLTKGKWYAMVIANGDFQLTVTGDASPADCEPLEGEGYRKACGFQLSSEGAITVVVQTGTTSVDGSLAVGPSNRD
jgi:hypothetical protein